MKFYVYILISNSSGKSYVGYTNNIERRLWEHNNHSKRSYTSRFRPWEIVYTEEFQSKAEAMKREEWFKTTSGRRTRDEIIQKYLENK